MTRRSRLVVAALLVLSTVVIAVPAGGTTAFFGVTDVTVTPSPPGPGETASISITVSNYQNSPSTIEVTDIAIRSSNVDTFREYARIEDVGKLAPGASLTVPLTHTFETTGTHSLRIHVWVQTGSGREHITYPVTVRVRSEHPSIGLEDGAFVEGATSPASITITNGLDNSIRDVSVTLHGVDVSGERESTLAKLASGASGALSFDVEPAAAGDRTLTAELSYTTEGDVRRTVNRTIRYHVDPLETGVALDTERVGDGAQVRATITNLGNVPVERLHITGHIGDRVVDRASFGTLGTDETRTVVLNASEVTGTDSMTVEATYRQAGEQRTTSATQTVSGNPATIELTGINLETENGKVHITGSTSNIGLTPASSVVVRVLASEGVDPAYPGRDYFVGTVPSSDFVSFDVYASVTENTTSIPLEVTYIRNGIQQRTTVEVPLENVDAANRQPRQSTGPNLPVMGIGAVVILAVAGLIGLGWRNYRDGT